MPPIFPTPKHKEKVAKQREKTEERARERGKDQSFNMFAYMAFYLWTFQMQLYTLSFDIMQFGILKALSLDN